jgi:hypothetical membrane protein
MPMGMDVDNERVTARAAERTPHAGRPVGKGSTQVVQAERPLLRVPPRGQALVAAGALSTGVVSLVALQALPVRSVHDPMSAPLSEYAFAPDSWLFDVSVLILAFALAVLASALVRGRCIASRSAACVLLGVCSVGLVAVVIFPEHDSSGAVRTAGYIHWVASMLTFGGLSVLPALLGRHGVSTVCSRLTSVARWMCAGTGPCFVLMATADVLYFRTTLPVPAWWFGLGERVLVALELVMAAVLTAWAWRGCACASAAARRTA